MNSVESVQLVTETHGALEAGDVRVLNATPVSWGQTWLRAPSLPGGFSPGVTSATPAVTTLHRAASASLRAFPIYQ